MFGTLALGATVSGIISADETSSTGFRWGNLVVVIVLFAVGIPLWNKVRSNVSRRRIERWEREGKVDPGPSDNPE